MGLGQLVDGTQILDYPLLLFWGDNSVTMLIKKTESHPSLGVVYYTCILHITDHTDSKGKKSVCHSWCTEKENFTSCASMLVKRQILRIIDWWRNTHSLRRKRGWLVKSPYCTPHSRYWSWLIDERFKALPCSCLHSHSSDRHDGSEWSQQCEAVDRYRSHSSHM